jgi:hypothetical protein
MARVHRNQFKRIYGHSGGMVAAVRPGAARFTLSATRISSPFPLSTKCTSSLAAPELYEGIA